MSLPLIRFVINITVFFVLSKLLFTLKTSTKCVKRALNVQCSRFCTITEMVILNSVTKQVITESLIALLKNE